MKPCTVSVPHSSMSCTSRPDDEWVIMLKAPPQRRTGEQYMRTEPPRRAMSIDPPQWMIGGKWRPLHLWQGPSPSRRKV
eukprot:1653774-Amphidinium_carterae.1